MRTPQSEPTTPPPPPKTFRRRYDLKSRCAAIAAALRAEAEVATPRNQTRRLNDLADLVADLADEIP